MGAMRTLKPGINVGMYGAMGTYDALSEVGETNGKRRQTGNRFPKFRREWGETENGLADVPPVAPPSFSIYPVLPFFLLFKAPGPLTVSQLGKSGIGRYLCAGTHRGSPMVLAGPISQRLGVKLAEGTGDRMFDDF